MKIAGSIFSYFFAAGLACAEINITSNGATLTATGSSTTLINQTVIVDGRGVPDNIVEGSGKTSSEVRTPGDFQQLQLNIAADVVITMGDITRCIVTADDNILPLILTESLDNVLYISAGGNYVTSRKVGVVLQVPQLTAAAINGSGRISLTGVAQDAVALAISGAGEIRATGKVNSLSVAINGSGEVTAGDLKAESVTATINGSGNTAVYATTALTAKVNGSGIVRYKGMPPVVHSTVRGSGGIAGD